MCWRGGAGTSRAILPLTHPRETKHHAALRVGSRSTLPCAIHPCRVAWHNATNLVAAVCGASARCLQHGSQSLVPPMICNMAHSLQGRLSLGAHMPTGQRLRLWAACRSSGRPRRHEAARLRLGLARARRGDLRRGAGVDQRHVVLAVARPPPRALCAEPHRPPCPHLSVSRTH